MIVSACVEWFVGYRFLFSFFFQFFACGDVSFAPVRVGFVLVKGVFSFLFSAPFNNLARPLEIYWSGGSRMASVCRGDRVFLRWLGVSFW